MNINDCLKHTENINKYHESVVNKFNNIKTILEQSHSAFNNNLQQLYYSIKHNEYTFRYHDLITKLIDTHHNATIATIDNIQEQIDHRILFNTLPKIEKYMTKDKKVKTIISYGKDKSTTNRKETKTPPPDYTPPLNQPTHTPVEKFTTNTPPLLYYIQPSYIYPLNTKANIYNSADLHSIHRVMSPKTPRRNRNNSVII